MVKGDELLFRKMAYVDGGNVDFFRVYDQIPSKRKWSILKKWDMKGWYEYGVALDLGWLTDLGKSEFSKKVEIVVPDGLSGHIQSLLNMSRLDNMVNMCELLDRDKDLIKWLTCVLVKG